LGGAGGRFFYLFLYPAGKGNHPGNYLKFKSPKILI
jgi:hypothetical protein